MLGLILRHVLLKSTFSGGYVIMTTISDEIIKNCRECFFQQGYGVKLIDQKGNILVCPLDSSHRYAINGGLLKRA